MSRRECEKSINAGARPSSGLQMVGSLDDNQLSARARGVKAHSSSCTWMQRIVRITCTRHGNIKSILVHAWFTAANWNREEARGAYDFSSVIICRGHRDRAQIIFHLNLNTNEIFVEDTCSKFYFRWWFRRFVASSRWISLNDIRILFQRRYVETFQGFK